MPGKHRSRVAGLAGAACALACAGLRAGAGANGSDAGRATGATVHEQFFCGVDARGEPAVGEVLSIDGAAPQATLGGAPLEDPAARALLAAALRVGARERPAALCETLRSSAPRVLENVSPLSPLAAEPGNGRRTFPLADGERARAGLRLRYAVARGGDFGASGVLLLSDGAGPEVELWRHGLTGEGASPGWIEGPWLLPDGRRVALGVGSVWDRGGPLHRTSAVRVADLRRGEAEMHNLHALDDYWAGDMEAARRELRRALDADPALPDALYNMASVYALVGDEKEAIRWLTLAVKEDPHRVRVLARGDADLRDLRRHEAVRKLLGIVRLPPADEEDRKDGRP